MNGELFSAVFLLLLVLDPLGNIPFVLSLLREVPNERRRHIILRESAVAVLVLIVFLFVGDWLLAAMRLTDPALEIAGGLILFLIALRMVFPPTEHLGAELAADQVDGEPFIVPLAIPMIAGPSALATVLLLASRQPGEIWTWVGALSSAVALTGGLLLMSETLLKWLGDSVMNAAEKLMGLILTAIAVNMLLSGIRSYFGL